MHIHMLNNSAASGGSLFHVFPPPGAAVGGGKEGRQENHLQTPDGHDFNVETTNVDAHAHCLRLQWPLNSSWASRGQLRRALLGRALPIQARAAIAFQCCSFQPERETMRDHGFRIAKEAVKGMSLSSRLLHPTSFPLETAMPGPTFGRIAKMKVTVFWVKSHWHNDSKFERCMGLFLG